MFKDAYGIVWIWDEELNVFINEVNKISMSEDEFFRFWKRR